MNDVVQEVPSLDASDLALKDFETQFLKPQRPCILRGYADWPAVRLWKKDYLREALGNLTATASVSTGNVHPDLGQAPSPPPTTKINLAHYIDLICSQSERARQLFVIGDNLPLYCRDPKRMAGSETLSRDVRFPTFFDKADLHFVGLWLSAPGVASRLHFDANGRHNLNVQIAGVKKLVLISPWRAERLHLYPAIQFAASFCQFSRVNPFAFDENFPDFVACPRFVGRIEPADAVFIPSYWFHAFEHCENVNVNVNFWWDDVSKLLNPVALREYYIAALGRCLPGGGIISARLAQFDDRVSKIFGDIERELLNASAWEAP